MINGPQRVPVVAGMTPFAQVGGDGMTRRFKGARTDAVMTSGAGTGLARHQGMVERRSLPGVGVVAGVTR